MEISDKQIKKLADYTKLDLDEKEKAKLKKDLSTMLETAKIIKDADTKGVEPLIGVNSNINVFRDDLVENDSSIKNQEQLLKIAPKTKDGFIQVNKMLD